MATVNKMKRPERMYAFNTTWLLWLAIFGVSLWGDIYLAVQEKKFSWVLALITLAVAIALFVDSLYYCFTKKELIHVHFWGYRWHLPWNNVSSVEKEIFIWGHSFPCYKIWYDRIHKGRTVRKMVSIASTPQTQKCLKVYFSGSISGEVKSKKKR